MQLFEHQQQVEEHQLQIERQKQQAIQTKLKKLNGEETIQCKDVIGANPDDKSAFHLTALNQAKQIIETTTGKKVLNPYYGWIKKQTPEETARFVEVFWCPNLETYLQTAYYNYFTSGVKDFYEDEK